MIKNMKGNVSFNDKVTVFVNISFLIGLNYGAKYSFDIGSRARKSDDNGILIMSFNVKAEERNISNISVTNW